MNEDSSYEALQSMASAPSGEVWNDAAVRETYRPNKLLANWLERHPDAPVARMQEAMRATVVLQAIGIESSDGHGEDALQLPDGTRREILSRIGATGALTALERVPEGQQTFVETTFNALLNHHDVPIDSDDRLNLSALLQASQWARATGMDVVVDAQDLKRRLRRLEFIERLGGKDLYRFVGRDAILRILHSAWNRLESLPGPMLIEGPGGMGKSLVVTRFIVDVLSSNDARSLPDAVFHLDFDRLSLQQARVSTILLELVQQSLSWCTEEQQRLSLIDLAQKVSAGDSDVESSFLNSRSSESLYDSELIVLELVHILSPFNDRPRILIFIDSFEQVETFDYVAAQSPRIVLSILRRLGVHFMAVFASRAFADPLSYSNIPVIRLRQFTVDEAQIYLRNEALRLGFLPSERTLVRTRKAVGRSPLALRLAVRLLEGDHHASDPSNWGELARQSPEFIQATLYDRVLRRIRNPQLRQLAVPGLLVRRLTADIIEKVLARPCGLPADEALAAHLMSCARKECQLFTQDEVDPDALRHRPDVRATMLANIDRTTAQEVFIAINQNAAAYYQQLESQGGPAFRTEELYHRLRLGQDHLILDSRWSDQSGRALRSSIKEFPHESELYLRRKLGAAAPQKIMSAVSLEPRTANTSVQQEMREFRAMADKIMQSGGSFDFIIERFKSEGSTLDGPLSDLYANALLKKGLSEQLLKSSRTLMVDSWSKVDPGVRCGVLSVVAGMLEGRDEPKSALTYWLEALRSANRLTDELIRLACYIGVIRSRRKASSGMIQRRLEILQSLSLLQLNLPAVLNRRVLSREVAAELGEVLDSDDIQNTDLMKLISHLLNLNEALPSTLNNPARASEIALKYFNISGAVMSQQLNGMLEKLLYSGPDERALLVGLLRQEVDWTLRQAAS